MPEIDWLLATKDEPDVAIFGITDENEVRIREFLSEIPTHYPMVSIPAGTLPPPFGDVRRIPTSFIIDRNGIIQFVRGYMYAEEIETLLWQAERRPAAPAR